MLVHLTPDAAIVILTLGVLLIYLELNRPGSILPGSLGLLLTLLAGYTIVKSPAPPIAFVLLVSAILLLTMELRIRTPPIFTVAATLALSLGFWKLAPSTGLHTATAAICGLLLGAGTFYLARIARRARASKRLD